MAIPIDRFSNNYVPMDTSSNMEVESRRNSIDCLFASLIPCAGDRLIEEAGRREHLPDFDSMMLLSEVAGAEKSGSNKRKYSRVDTSGEQSAEPVLKRIKNKRDLHMPMVQVVDGDFDLRGKRFTNPTDHQHIRGDLYLDARDFHTLPQNLLVDGKIIVRGDLHLYTKDGISIPQCGQGIYIYGDCDLHGTDIADLPKGFHVSGSLDLEGSDISRLPQGLDVRGELNLEDTQITFVPEDIQLGGDLRLSYTPITSLPESITTLGFTADGEIRHIYLENTALSEDIVERLRNSDTPGIQFHFSNQAADPMIEFGSIAEGLSFWKNIADFDEDCVFEVDGMAEQDVRIFLARLTETAEYKNTHSRAVLAKRIINIFTLMAGNAEMKERGLVIISNGLTSCDDRIISALDQLDLIKQIHDAEQLGVSEAAERRLIDLGKGLFYLEKVQDAARAHATTLTWVDEIEVQLAFQLGLKERFNLPLSTSNMIFRGCAQVTDAQIESAGNSIQAACSEADERAFLAQWEPWVKFQRKKGVIPYYALPTISQAGVFECSISYAVATQPVLYAGNVYSYGAFVKNFIARGTDPFTQQPIHFSNLQRIDSRS